MLFRRAIPVSLTAASSPYTGEPMEEGEFTKTRKMETYPNRYVSMGPRKAGRRGCAVQVFSPGAKTLAQPELTSGEHWNNLRIPNENGLT